MCHSIQSEFCCNQIKPVIQNWLLLESLKSKSCEQFFYKWTYTAKINKQDNTADNKHNGYCRILQDCIVQNLNMYILPAYTIMINNGYCRGYNTAGEFNLHTSRFPRNRTSIKELQGWYWSNSDLTWSSIQPIESRWQNKQKKFTSHNFIECCSMIIRQIASEFVIPSRLTYK